MNQNELIQLTQPLDLSGEKLLFDEKYPFARVDESRQPDAGGSSQSIKVPRLSLRIFVVPLSRS